MKNIKKKPILIVGIVVVLGLITWAYIAMTAEKAPPLVSCAVGDKFDVMTGDICFPHYEEEAPTTTAPVDYSRG